VTFKACKKGEPVAGSQNAMTQFNGGLVVAGVRGVPLEVFVREEGRAIRASDFRSGLAAAPKGG
jgi:hypothetical protein